MHMKYHKDIGRKKLKSDKIKASKLHKNQILRT